MSFGNARVSDPDLWQIPDPSEGTPHSACASPTSDLWTLHHGPGAHHRSGGAAAHKRTGGGVPEGGRAWRETAESPGKEGTQHWELGEFTLVQPVSVHSLSKLTASLAEFDLCLIHPIIYSCDWTCISDSVVIRVVGAGCLPRLSVACGRPLKSWVGLTSHELQW